MAKKEEAPSTAQFLSGYPPEVRALAQALRELFRESVPNSIEAVYPGWQLIGYRARDGRRTAYFGFIAPQQDKAFLGFEWGVLLRDPRGLLEGQGKQVRQVRIERPDQIKPDLLAPLIAEAAHVALLSREEKAALLMEREALDEAEV